MDITEVIDKDPIKCDTPFLLCIPPAKRGNIINKLGEYQEKYYDTKIDFNLRAQPHEIPASDITGEVPENIGQFMANNSDIKARMK
jgi:hypothetical protein